MTTDGVNLSTIGFFGLVGLPYSLKFLWAPLLDRYSFPFLGRRKGWLMVTQLALAISIAAMFVGEPSSDMQFFAAVAVAIAFLSATQDITVDAYNADIVEPHETGAGAGIKVLGYRIALILTGSVALILADHWNWPAVYLFMGGVMIALLLVSMLVPEPPLAGSPPQTLNQAVRQPFEEFFKRNGALQALLILMFVILYRFGDSMIDRMTTPFLIQTGFSQSDVGAIQGGVGLMATIVGVLAGGAILSNLGIGKSLWIFGILQAASNFGYMLLAQAGRSYGLMVAAIIVDNICTGLATAALVGFLISQCDPRFSATQYALLSSLMAVGRDLIASPAGVLAEKVGWPTFYLITIFAAIPGLILLLQIGSDWTRRAAPPGRFA
jgi:PAT family beta-lactamase induction signal transducer AmpG